MIYILPKPARTIVALALTTLLLAGCGNESATIRYRATAEVVIDGEVRSGSAVREATYSDTPNSLTGFGMSIADRGEAIIVDIGDGHGVYILRNDRSGSGSRLAGTMRLCFGVDIGDAGWTDGFDALPVGQTCRIQPNEMSGIMPLIVAFRSETVPKSIFEVTPKTLKSVFGVEGRFQGMTFEKVSRKTPLTKAVDARLPWLDDIPFEGTTIRGLDPYFPPTMPASDATLAQRVGDYYFRD
ncbi:hypothetical protein [Ahrensia marina]|uniref:Lipoprotein n=1 Tax=Ahrensia marina TaxID=1514904 RepID=A0A0M9GNI7_9HYPH|nr:hypothetical protein [Ahrensia marina]KPB01679.1 hypothetical protein SU32_07385 [Ahrensia marina]